MNRENKSGKWREYWLDPLLSPRNSIYTEPSETCIHVIEYEAFVSIDFKFLCMVLVVIGFSVFMHYSAAQFVIERTVKQECLNEKR